MAVEVALFPMRKVGIFSGTKYTQVLGYSNSATSGVTSMTKNILHELKPAFDERIYLINQKDTVCVRSRYKDFDREFVLHHHILDHEDPGNNGTD